MTAPTIDTPAAAVAALCEALAPVGVERVGWRAAPGRVLAEPLLADRDSPACDVSAMDGYAVRLADVVAGAVPVAGEAHIGQPAPLLPAGAAVKIVTGAALPAGAEAVVRREDTVESPDCVRFKVSDVQGGQYIRRRGENARAGEELLPAGSLITPAGADGLAAFGMAAPLVHRKVRVGIITTGNELVGVDSAALPWQIRDANGAFLEAALGACARLEVALAMRVKDEPLELANALDRLLDACDAVILTGGVSMGDYDHVPAIIAGSGARILFHRLPVRPGHPILGAIGPGKQLILGLPGNPLSVMTGVCRFGGPALARLSGLALRPPVGVMLTASCGAGFQPARDAGWKPAPQDDKRLALWWFRPVTIGMDGKARLASSRGSGDIPSAVRSDGFIELPPNVGGLGPWPFYRWEI